MITGCKLSTDHLNVSRFMLGNICISFYFQLFRFWPELFICDGLTDGEFESGRSKEWVRLKASPKMYLLRRPLSDAAVPVGHDMASLACASVGHGGQWRH